MFKHLSQEAEGKVPGVGEESTTGPGEETCGSKIRWISRPLKYAKARSWLIAIIEKWVKIGL